MRVLHTSDWHLGRTFHGAGMLEAQRSVLSQMAETVREEGVDLVLLAGDVYDRALPAVDAVQLFDEALVQLRATGAQVVISSGNHDSASRLGFASRLLSSGGIHLRTSLEQLTDPVLLGLGAGGQLAVYGVPYLEPRLVAPTLGAEEATHTAVTAAALGRIREDLAARREHGPVRAIAMAHTFASTGVSSESERSLGVGGLGVVPAGIFEEDFDFVALGHLHGRQEIRPHIRYSGSPLAYSFGEADQVKGGWIFDITAEGLGAVRPVSWEPVRRLARLRGQLEQLLADPAHTAAEEMFCQITLTDPSRPARAMEQLRQRFPHTLVLQHDPEGAQPKARGTYRARIAQAVDDVDLAASFLEHVRGRAVDDLERQDLVRAIEDARTAEHSA